jgi:hypothetical protein|tara:strand:- start:48 stop:302 length:255 start_codon:yes stop_codon:yes gene_type:complete
MGQPLINPATATSIKIYGLANSLNKPLSHCKDEQERKELLKRKTEALIYFNELGAKLDIIKDWNENSKSGPTKNSLIYNKIKSI